MKKHNLILLIGAIFFITLLARVIILEIKTEVKYLCSQELDEYQRQECGIFEKWNCYEENSKRCEMTEYNIRNTFKS